MMNFTGPVFFTSKMKLRYQMICRSRYCVLHRKKRTLPYGNYDYQTTTGSVPYWFSQCCGFFVWQLPIVFPDPTFSAWFRNFLLCCWFLIKFLTKFFPESVKPFLLQPYCWDQQQKITPVPGVIPFLQCEAKKLFSMFDYRHLLGQILPVRWAGDDNKGFPGLESIPVPGDVLTRGTVLYKHRALTLHRHWTTYRYRYTST